MIDTTAGRARQATWLYGAADALLRSVGATGQVTFSRVQDRDLAVSRDALGTSAFSDAFEAGQRTSLQRIMENNDQIGAEIEAIEQGARNVATHARIGHDLRRLP